MEYDLNSSFWENRYLQKDIGWDIGYASPPITNYLGAIKNKELKILIPGAGNSYEAEWALNNGFSNVHILDYARSAINNFKKRCTQFNESNIHIEDFFEHKGEYDLIIEQTFFCAINPSLRNNYALKMNGLLKDNGLLVGLLFDAQFAVNPPYGGNKEEYVSIFSSLFSFLHFEKCYNSINPRDGKELFIEFRKKII